MNSKLKTLEAIINRANSAILATMFFPVLSKFVTFLREDPKIVKYLQPVIKEGLKVHKDLSSAKKSGLQELKAKEKLIRKYIINQGANNKTVIQMLDVFCERLERLKDKDTLHTLRTSLELALSHLLNDDTCDHTVFLQTFGEIKSINDYKYINLADAFPKFDAWDKKLTYITHQQQNTVWYSLDQLVIFFQRYDLQHHDQLIEKLTKSSVDTATLEHEHIVLFNYARFDNQKTSPLFPSIEEYKHHMLNIMTFLATCALSSTHYYSYDPLTGELQIDDDKPINYQTHKNPAKLLKQVHDKNKPLSFLDVHIVLGLSEKHHKVTSLGPIEVKEIDSFIRLVNDPIKRTGKPPFFVTQIRKDSRKEREIFVSSCYKPF